MTSDKKTSKAEPATKAKPAPKTAAAADSESTASVQQAKPEAGEKLDASPANYSRGEGQKPVTRAYRENWNAIFAKKGKKR